MKFASSVYCFVAVVITTVTGQERDWNYSGPQGPATWADRYPACNGSRQSPIDITIDAEQLGLQLKWRNYDLTPVAMQLTNEGYTVRLNCTWKDEGATPSVTYNNIQYNFDSLHFHWGSSNDDGSEHSVYGKKYSLEMHLVHRQTETTGSNVLVVAVMYEITFFFFGYFSNLQTIVNDLPKIETAHSETSLSKMFPLANLLPNSYQTASFYSYEGSLTTPPCTENVQWIIFYPLESVTSSQLRQFRSLKDESGNNIVSNFRPLQPRNDRTVTFFRYQ